MLTDKLKTIAARVGLVIVIFGAVGLVMWAMSNSSKSIKEETFASRQDLKFTRYCLNGFFVLKVHGAINGDTGYMYELNVRGEPVKCQ